MFIEINDISTGTVVNEPLNAYSINYAYGRQNDSGKYNLIYVLDNGIRKIEEFNSQSDLEDKLEEIRDLSGGGAVANVYTYKGSCTFENLPASGNVVGDVWNITDDFELGGKSYPAGTNVAWDGLGWDALAGSVDLSAYASKEYLMTDNYLRFVDVKYSDSYPKESVDLSTLTKTGVYFINGYNTGTNHNYPIAIKLRGITSSPSGQPTGCQGIGILYLYKTYADAANNEYFARMYGTGWDTAGLKNVVCEIKKSNSNNTGINVDTTPNYNYIIRGTTLNSDSQTINGTKTFNSLPVSSGTPTQNNQLVNKAYVDSQSVSFKPFTAGFPTTGTTQDFLTAVQALNLPTGNVYLGGVTFSDLPFNGNAEVEVYIYPNNVIFCILRSANVAPYIWSCNSHTYRGWEPVGQTIQYSTMPTADSSNADRIVEYVGATDANYTNGYFYKNIYTPGVVSNLTEAEALSGIDSFTLPETFTLSSIPVAGTNIHLTADDIGDVLISPYDDSGAYYINVTINKLTGTEIHTLVQYGSGDGLEYSLNIGQAGTYTFADDLVLLNGVWDDFVGPILLQETAASYNWQQINVQPASDMSNYYTKAEIDNMLGDIQEVLETLTLPTAVEEELSEI